MRLAELGVALSLSVAALWLFEFGVLCGGLLYTFLFVLLVFLAGFPSALSEAALAASAPTPPSSLRRIDGRLELVGWLALVNAVWLAGTLGAILGLTLAVQMFLSSLPTPWLGRVAATQLTAFLLWHATGCRTAGTASFWIVVVALTLVLGDLRRRNVLVKLVMLAVMSLAAFAALSVASPGGVNPGLNYFAEGGRGFVPPLALIAPVLSVGVGVGVVFRSAIGEADAGFQSAVCSFAAIGLVFLASIAFFSGGGASGMVDAARLAYHPAPPLEVFSWWLTSSASLSAYHGLLGRAVAGLLACSFTLVSAFGCAATIESTASFTHEELRSNRWVALALVAASAISISLATTIIPLWAHLVFFECWLGVGVCIVALVEVIAAGWAVGVKQVANEFLPNPPRALQTLLNLAVRFASPVALAVVIVLLAASPWLHVYALIPPLTPLTPLTPQDAASAPARSLATWLSTSMLAVLALKSAAKRRRKNG